MTTSFPTPSLSARIHDFGQPPLMKFHKADIPAPADHQVRVRIQASSVNPLDAKIMSGSLRTFFPITFPYSPGTDFSGVVESVGAMATLFKAGDRVAGRTNPTDGGAFSTHVSINEKQLVRLPDSMSFEQAASLPTVFGTAYLALTEIGGIKAGQHVLIHAGAGGVGSMAVQISKLLGAHVTATASPASFDLVKSLGADTVVDYRQLNSVSLQNMDLVLDTVGGDTLEASWNFLKPDGLIASLVDSNIQTRGNKKGTFVFFADARPFLPHAFKWFNEHNLQVLIDSIYPLTDLQLALQKVASQRAKGKVVLRHDKV